MQDYSGETEMKNPRTWLAIMVPVALMAIVGLIITSGTDKESHNLQSDDQATEVSFITGSEIPELLANDRYSMIEFGGRSCIPCKQMQPILAELIAAHGTVIDIVNVYLDDDFTPADTFDVYLLPTQVIFDKNGEELSRHMGIWLRVEVEEEYRRLGIIE